MFKIAAAVVVIATAALYLFFSNAHATPLALVGDGKISPSEFSVAIQGWRPDELRTIISQFDDKYDLGADTFAIEEQGGSTLRVRATKGIDADQVFFLVNYIMYPENFDLTHRTLNAVGQLKLSDETGVPPGTKRGQQAWIYMPSDDHDYDVAYVRLDNGQSYRVSFTNMGWELVKDPRLPAPARDLIDQSKMRT